MIDNPFDRDELADAFEGDLYYLVSDQFYSRDDIFKMPVRNRKLFLKHAHTYFEFCKTIPPESDLYPRYNALQTMFRSWQADGEDVDRIFNWYKSLSKWGVAKEFQYWALVFWWWANGKALDMQQHLPKERFNAFLYHIRKDYTIPRKKFDVLTKNDEQDWVGEDGKGNRSDWDEYLWEIFLKELWMSPETVYTHWFDNLLMMKFWKKHRYFLSLEEQQLLLVDMINIQLDHESGNFMDWESIDTLENTLTIDNWPDFDIFKRDWQ